MHKIGSLLFFTFFVLIEIKSQSIIGIWETIDDITGKAKSHVEIYEKSGKIYGKVIKLLPGASVTTCNNCPGEKNGKYKDYWSYGQVVDPKNGKIYSGNIWLEGDNLKLRGYIGISLIGRSQIWHKVK